MTNHSENPIGEDIWRGPDAKDPIINLYRDSFPDFARLIRRMGRTPDEAQNACHDALLIYLEHENGGKLQVRSSPKAWLLGTARICWLHTKSKETLLPANLDLAEYETESKAEEEREQTLLQSLMKTGKKCMELLKAFYYDNRSMQDIA